jgi:hypothetical protein
MRYSAQMPMAVLIEKLLQAGVVERQRGALRFTSRFAGYLIWTAGTGQILDSTTADWRKILTMFSPSLESLSTDEIKDAVSLFEYYLRHPDTAINER